jgi:hypothetical protein
MLSIFIVSAALLHTGLADRVADGIRRVIGDREIPLTVALMVVGLVLVGVLGLLVYLGVNGHIKTGLYSSVALLIQGLRRKEKR